MSIIASPTDIRQTQTTPPIDVRHEATLELVEPGEENFTADRVVWRLVISDGTRLYFVADSSGPLGVEGIATRIRGQLAGQGYYSPGEASPFDGSHTFEIRPLPPLPHAAWGDLSEPRSIAGLDEVVVTETQAVGAVDQPVDGGIHQIEVTIDAMWISTGGQPFAMEAPPAVRVHGLDGVDPDADGVRELARLLTKAADFLDRIGAGA